MSLKNLPSGISIFLDNKYATILLLIASFFAMLSIKIVPLMYKFIRDIDFKTYAVFPLDIFDYFLWFLIFIALKMIIGSLAQYIAYNKTHLIRNAPTKTFIWLMLFFLLAWLPYFLTFYPGTVFYDEMIAMRDPWGTANQPLFYGYILNFFWNIGIFFNDETLGFAIFVILRMIIFSASFSYLICFLYDRGIKLKFLIVAAAIFAFFPIFPNNAITIQKDGLYSCFILILSLFLYQYKNSISVVFSEKKPFFMFAVISILIILFRSNGVHIIFVTLIVFWFLEKNIRLRIFLYILFILAVAIIPNRGRHVPFEETVGVPIQQVGRTIYNDGYIKEPAKNVFQNIMDFNRWKKTYCFDSVDSTKWNNGFNRAYLKGHKLEFLKAWADTFPRNISIYFTAHALNTFDFWTIAPWMIYGNQIVYAGAITKEQLNVNDIGGKLKMYLVSDEFLKKDTSEKIARFMSDHTMYLNAGTCAFIMLLVMALILQMKRERSIIPLLPLFFSWLTVLIASPLASAFRYVLYLAFLMPFILAIPFLTDEEFLKENNNEQ